MSRLPSPAAAAVARAMPSASRPILLDYFLLVVGFALSQLLVAQLPYPVVSPGSRAVGPVLSLLVPALPALLRLSDGVILLWPLFLGIQRVMGREQSLTVAEWLWVFAWLGAALLIGLAALARWGSLPEFLREYAHYPAFVCYVILIPSMALIALLVALFGMFGGAGRPWTHGLALALILWPVVPLVGILALAEQPVVWDVTATRP